MVVTMEDQVMNNFIIGFLFGASNPVHLGNNMSLVDTVIITIAVLFSVFAFIGALTYYFGRP